MSTLLAFFRLTAVFGMVAAVSATAHAGEDSTHRWNGTGPAWYETPCGLKGFAEARATGSPEPLVSCAKQAPGSARGGIGSVDQAVGGRTALTPNCDTTAANGSRCEQVRRPVSPRHSDRDQP